MLKINNLLRYLHVVLSVDLDSALKSDSVDPAYVNLLFIVFIISFASLFLSEGYTAHLMFIYIVMPTAFLPLKFKFVNIRGLILIQPKNLSFYNVFRNTVLCRTPLFLAFLLYTTNKAFLSYLYPEPNLDYLYIFFYYLLAPLLILMITVTRLSVDIPNFYFKFFRIMGPIAAINVILNIYFYLKSFSNLSLILETHMTAVYGAAIGYNPNQDCLVYVLYFIGLAVTLIHNFSRNDFYFSAPSVVILLVGLLLEQSRSTLLGAFISLILLNLLSSKATRSGVILALLGLTLLTLIYSSIFLPNGLATYFLRGESHRFEVWKLWFNILLQDPIIGFGDRTIREIFISSGEKLLHAHSILLSSWLRGGLLGLGSMLYIAVFGIRCAFLYAKTYNNFVPFCVFVVVAVDGVFNSELKVWQAGWEWAGYWIAIALILGADAKLRNGLRMPI